MQDWADVPCGTPAPVTGYALANLPEAPEFSIEERKLQIHARALGFFGPDALADGAWDL